MKLSWGLANNEDGIWFKTETASLSYPILQLSTTSFSHTVCIYHLAVCTLENETVKHEGAYNNFTMENI